MSSECYGRQQDFVRTKQQLELVVLNLQTLLHLEQIRIRIFQSDQIRNARLRLFQKLDHRQPDIGHGRNIVEIERYVARGRGNWLEKQNQLADVLWSEV